MNILHCLPDSLAILHRYVGNMRELRLRANRAVYVDVAGTNYYVGIDSLLSNSRGAVVLEQSQIQDILSRACQGSIYAYEDSLVNGYMTMDDGVRIGVAGTVSGTDSNIKCFARYTSLCVRFPHHISNSSFCISDVNPQSTLVVGMPGSGKTTFLRDILCRLSAQYNCICIDDRGELTQCDMFDNCAHNVDTMLYGDKVFSMNMAIRSLAPQCIVTDEIVPRQYDSIRMAIDSGVHIYASMHGNSINVVERLNSSGIVFGQIVLLDKAQRASVYQNTPNGIVL